MSMNTDNGTFILSLIHLKQFKSVWSTILPNEKSNIWQ